MMPSRSGTAASICSSTTSAADTPPTCMVIAIIGSMTASVPSPISCRYAARPRAPVPAPYMTATSPPRASTRRLSRLIAAQEGAMPWVQRSW